MPAIKNNDIARAIYLFWEDNNLEALPLLRGKASKFGQVVNFLAKRRLLGRAPDILARLDKIINDSEGRIVARVSSGQEMNDAEKRGLARALAKRYSAKEAVIVPVLDKKLLGGFKIEVGDEVMDLTIKNRIEKLQAHLIK